MSTPQFLSVQEIADRLSVSKSTIQRHIKNGRLPSVLIGGSRRVREDDLATFIESISVIRIPQPC